VRVHRRLLVVGRNVQDEAIGTALDGRMGCAQTDAIANRVPAEFVVVGKALPGTDDVVVGESGLLRKDSRHYFLSVEAGGLTDGSPVLAGDDPGMKL
jgi:hypothetical protein